VALVNYTNHRQGGPTPALLAGDIGVPSFGRMTPDDEMRSGLIRRPTTRSSRITAYPYHFTLSDEDMAAYDSNHKMKPPLRSPCHRDATVASVAAGTIAAIATDHAPHAGSEKMQEFERCPFGIIGLETAVALALEQLVATGTLAPGAPGDVTVFTTEVEWTYHVNQSHSRSRNSPFHGSSFKGGPMATVVDGEMKWRRWASPAELFLQVRQGRKESVEPIDSTALPG
jgi:dihydroorotase-like cyclic amidohydrolase